MEDFAFGVITLSERKDFTSLPISHSSFRKCWPVFRIKGDNFSLLVCYVWRKQEEAGIEYAPDSFKPEFLVQIPIFVTNTDD